MQQETYYVKIVGKANVPNPVPIGHNYKITIDASVTQEQKDDNEDGTFNITYKAEPITMEITADNGKITKAKDTRRKSQLMRSLMMKKWKDNNVATDFEEWHDRLYNQMMSDLDNTILKIK